jgi:hypothetical protein
MGLGKSWQPPADYAAEAPPLLGALLRDQRGTRCPEADFSAISREMAFVTVNDGPPVSKSRPLHFVKMVVVSAARAFSAITSNQSF